MRDQADELRQLVRQRIADGTDALVDAPFSQGAGGIDARNSGLRKIVVSAGKGGVGTTTVAVNLAVALGRLGCRTILVDADLSGADATWLCGVESKSTLHDVLSGRHTLHEVLCPGPAGIQVAPGVWSPEAVPDCSPSAQQRMLRQVDQMERHADWLIFDAGCGINHFVRQLWQAADEVLLVTTGEAVAIMDAYAAIKLFLGEMPHATVRTVVSQSRSDAEAAAVHARLATAVRRFLGMSLASAGSLPWDSAVPLAAAAGKPLVFGHAGAQATQAIEQLAEQLAFSPRPTARG